MVRYDEALGAGDPLRCCCFRDAKDIRHIGEVLAVRLYFSRRQPEPPSGHATAALVMLPVDR